MRFVIFAWVIDRLIRFEIGCFHPYEIELVLTPHGSVLERLDDGHVRVLQSGILAYQNDIDGIEPSFLPVYPVSSILESHQGDLRQS